MNAQDTKQERIGRMNRMRAQLQEMEYTLQEMTDFAWFEMDNIEMSHYIKSTGERIRALEYYMGIWQEELSE